jgi:hypothetical protein
MWRWPVGDEREAVKIGLHWRPRYVNAQRPKGVGVTLLGPHEQRAAVTALLGPDRHGASVRPAGR